MKDERPRELAILSQAYHALAQARTIEEVKDIRDKAEAARKYAQCAMLGLETQNRCAEIKLRAERKAGKLLAELHLSSGRPGKKKWSQHATILKELGINKSQSSRWQMEAEVPEEIFQLYLTDMQEQGKELTAQGLVRISQQHAAKLHFQARRQHPSKTAQRCTASSPILELRQSNRAKDERTLEQASTLVGELVDHRRLLANLLEQFCKRETVRSELIQRRTVARLLSEMDEILTTLGIILHAEGHR